MPDKPRPAKVVTIGGEVVPERRLADEYIARLRKVLQQAEDGQLEFFAIAYGRTDGWCETDYAIAAGVSRMRAIGTVARLEHRLQMDFDQ